MPRPARGRPATSARPPRPAPETRRRLASESAFEPGAPPPTGGGALRFDRRVVPIVSSWCGLAPHLHDLWAIRKPVRADATEAAAFVKGDVHRVGRVEIGRHPVAVDDREAGVEKRAAP